MANFVAGRKCKRCDGKGFIAAVAHNNMGRCFTCAGAGMVETDKATIQAAKDYVAARRALGAAALAFGHEAHSGLSLLEVNAPERVVAAVASFASGRCDVVSALVDYYRSL